MSPPYAFTAGFVRTHELTQVIKIFVNGQHIGYVPPRCREQVTPGPAVLVDSWLVLCVPGRGRSIIRGAASASTSPPSGWGSISMPRVASGWHPLDTVLARPEVHAPPRPNAMARVQQTVGKWVATARLLRG